MSIDSSEYTCQNSNSSGNRAPPPPFSSQTFAQSQRKRPALSNLGIEVSLASDVKTPNTPTPNFTTEPLDSSDAVLKIRPTPTPPVEQQQPYQHQHQHAQPHQQYYNHHISNHNNNDIREPQLSIILESLSDFQNSYDQKTHRIETLEMHLRQLSDQLQHREVELQSASIERITNLKTLEGHKQQLRELETKLKEFSKYEDAIASKVESLETLMSEMSSIRANYLQQESQLKQEIEDAEKRIKDNLKIINEMRIEKESLESQKEALENENKDRCTEFNGKIYELNSEIKEKGRKIELLIGEKEVLLSDLKNITKDRDSIQKECSKALKEITELAVSGIFAGCESKDLGSLECSISWIKGKCMELNNCKVDQELELVNFKQTIQELEKHVTSKTGELKEKSIEIERLKSELDLKEQDLDSLQNIIEENKALLDSVNEFKRKVKSIGVSDDFDKIIEKLSQKSLDKKFESLSHEINSLKKQHEKELEAQKEEYSLLLREENSKWKFQREELENELLKLKKNQQQQQTNLNSKSFNQTGKSQEADLTAIIKDLKESSDLLTPTSTNNKKRISSRTNLQASNNVYNSNKRRQTAASGTSQNSQKMSSPSSVNSNDIWNLFK